MANVTEVVTDIWNPQLGSKQTLSMSLRLLSHEGAGVSLPCSLGCLRLQMATTTLGQPTSK